VAVTSHLKSLQALELALRTGSLQAAAKELSITPAAAGQRVKALEEYLGVDLLVRGRTGLKATPALTAARGHLDIAFRELAAASDILQMQRGQEIHIAAVSDFVDLWLDRRLGRFKESHTNVAFCINGEGEPPLRLGPVDCEIWFGPRSDAAHNDVLFGDFVLPISSPENTQRIARLRKRDRLEGFPLLHLDFFKNDPVAPGWAEWIRSQRFRRTAPERGIRFQRIAPALEAVLANAGLSICGLALVSEYLEDGRISLPFPVSTGVATEHVFQARYNGAALVRPQVRQFRKWLIAESEQTSAWLARLASKLI
jgi:LysR family glycine cleavage system transcriptional activator